MPDLVETPNGWVERYPTHCSVGHRFTAHKVTVGFDGVRRYFYCEQDGHPDRASRWLFMSTSQEPAPIPLGTPDHGLMGS